MTISNTLIDDQYQDVIDSLRKVNDALFYKELKKLINDREETLAGMNEEIHKSLANMEKTIKRIPNSLSSTFKEEVVTPQSDMFDQGMEQFNENLLILENKIAVWHQEYENYLQTTEKLISDLKEIQMDDREFILGQTAKIIDVSEKHKEQLNFSMVDLAKTVNQHQEALNQQNESLVRTITAIETKYNADQSLWNKKFNQIVKEKEEQEIRCKELWKLGDDYALKRVSLLKKWLIGLALGQAISIILVIIKYI